MTEDELFITAILNCSRSELYTRPVQLNDEQNEQFEVMKWRRAAGEPVQYICGFTEFMGHRMEVGPGVLVPRPETEVLVDAVLQTFKAEGQGAPFMLDIGTGSGCIPISLLKEVPGARAVGLDVSPDALGYARRNASLNGVSDRLEFIERDVFWYMDETRHRFDAVITNPPYIPTFQLGGLPVDVRREPELALDGGPDGLHFYRFIVPTAWRVLKGGGLIALEFGDGQRKELENLLAITGGWDKIQVLKDNAGRNRVIIARKMKGPENG